MGVEPPQDGIGALLPALNLGHMVQGRKRSRLYEGTPQVCVAQSEWSTVYSTHGH